MSYEVLHPCKNCLALISTDAGGYCASNGHSHQPHSEKLYITYGAREGETAQGSWLRCTKCEVIYWAGDPNDQGVCDLGGPHEGDRDQSYLMPHDIQVTKYNQTGWKFCGKCRAMFYDGGENKGNCPAAGPHQSISTGLAYVLPTAAPVKFD